MSETPEVELARLKKEQDDALKTAVFIGFSPSEKWQYDANQERIRVLLANAVAWGQTSETDTHQGEARQSYRSREENSSKAYTDSQADSREVRRKKSDTE